MAMCWMTFRRLLLIVGLIGILLLIIQVNRSPDDGKTSVPGDEPVILWWTPFGSDGTSRRCGESRCHFTQDRIYRNHQNLKAILFYGSNLEINDLPIPRGTGVQWGLLHEESPRNNLMFVHEEALKLFNYSSTFSRFSDVPLTLVDLPGVKDLSDTKFFTPTNEKNRLMRKEKLSPLLYLQSNCDTLSDRDSYIQELMKHIPVDAYGTCLNNRKLPEHLRNHYIESLTSDELKKFVGRYKFTLAFENAVCDDYITEKLWRPLIAGSVPVYYGSPTFKDWLPNNSSAVAVQDFESPKHLAEFLHRLIKSDAEYERYLGHKLTESGVTNARLLEQLRRRPTDVVSVFENYLRTFECQVCAKIHRKEVRTASRREYNCEKPDGRFDFDGTLGKNSWIYVWDMEKCTGKLLTEYLVRNQTFQSRDFKAKKMRMYRSNQC